MKILIVTRTGMDYNDGASQSIRNIFETLPKFDVTTEELILKTRKRFGWFKNMEIARKVKQADAIILNSCTVAFDDKIQEVLDAGIKLKKAIYWYIRENHKHYPSYFGGEINQNQQDRLLKLARNTSIHRWFVSDYSQQSFNDYFKTEGKSSTVIYNGIDFSNYSNVNRNDKKVNNITAIGSIQANKGYTFFLDFAEKFNSAYPEFSFSWYGNGLDKNNFQELIDSRNLSNVVRIHPHAELNQIMQQCGGIIVCSEAESFSRVAVEAMYFGKSLFVRESTTGTLEISDPARKEVKNEISDNVIHDCYTYLQEDKVNSKAKDLLTKYSIDEHCKRILQQLNSKN